MRRLHDRLTDRFLWLKSLGVALAIGIVAWFLTILPDLGGLEKWVPILSYSGLGGATLAGTYWGNWGFSQGWLLGGLFGFIGFAVGRTDFWEPLVNFRAKKITREAAVAEMARRYGEFVDIFEKAHARAA